MPINISITALFTRIIVVIFITIIFSDNAFGIWIDPYIKGVDTKNVKIIKIDRYRFVDGNWREVDAMTAEYNNLGNLIKETRYTAEDILQFEYVYSYDQKGQLIKTKGRRMRRENIVPYEYIYKYDQRGNQIESIGYGKDGSVTSRYTARYDINNNYIEGLRYEKGVAVSKYIAEYDERNNLLKESKYKVYQYKNAEHYQLEYKHLFTYDGKNNLITEKNYGNDGKAST